MKLCCYIKPQAVVLNSSWIKGIVFGLAHDYTGTSKFRMVFKVFRNDSGGKVIETQPAAEGRNPGEINCDSQQDVIN